MKIFGIGREPPQELPRTLGEQLRDVANKVFERELGSLKKKILKRVRSKANDGFMFAWILHNSLLYREALEPWLTTLGLRITRIDHSDNSIQVSWSGQ